MAKEIWNRSGTSTKKLNIVAAARPIEFHGSWDIEDFDAFHADLDGWIHRSTQSVIGLPSKSYIVSGLTDAFHQVYSVYNKIGIYHGEYGYHAKVFPNRVTHNLEDADIIIISHPFSADGLCSHKKIREANKIGKPIFIDCAFFGICAGIDFDFSPYKNIHSVGFSLSKTFGTGLQRVGLLYTNSVRYPVSVYGEWQYPLTASAMYHYDLIKKIGPDDMYKKYRLQQEEICDTIGAVPSDTVIFGLDYSDRYNHLRRGDVNRLCISKEFNVKDFS